MANPLEGGILNLTYETRFDAAHCLEGYPGKCAAVHGHTYRLLVVVSGRASPETGMVVDFQELKKLVDTVVDLVDHTYLNSIQHFGGRPTAERLVAFLGKCINDSIHEHFEDTILLEYVRLWETPDCSAGYSPRGRVVLVND